MSRLVRGDGDVRWPDGPLTNSHGRSRVRFGGREVAASVLEPTEVVVDRGGIRRLRTDPTGEDRKRAVVVVASVVEATAVFAHHPELVEHACDLERLGPREPLGNLERLLQ